MREDAEMKIAFIVNNFPIVSQTFILNQITGLLDLGHDVEIFANFNPKERIVHPDVEKYHLMERVNYFDDMILIPDSAIMRVLKAIYLIILNCHKKPLKILKALNVFKYGKEALSFRLFYLTVPFLDKDFDIIHCHFGPNGIVGAYLKELALDSKLITTFHGYDLSSFVLNNDRNIYNFLFSKGDLFMPISEHWKERLVEMGCDEKEIMVHHMGIDLEHFKFFERPITENIKILSVGRLVEKKGHEYAIKAVAKVVSKHKTIIYQIAGDGPLKCELESLVTKLGIENYIKFLGNVVDDELLKLYRDSHIFALPSVTAGNGDQEGIPVVLMEAQATGLPVISTFHSGIPEVVADGKSGYLVPERDVDAMTKKLEYLVVHPEIWSEMGRAGRKFIEARYDVRKLNQQLVKRYKALLTADTTLLDLKEPKNYN